MPRLGTGENSVDVESQISFQCWSLVKEIREKSRFIFGVLFFVTIAILLNTKRKSTTVKEVCSTPECIASGVRERMDFQMDPCDDFYSFACGKFVEQTEIPRGKSTIGSFSDIDELVGNQLDSMLSDSIHGNDIEPFKLAKKLYKKCSSTTDHLNEFLQNLSYQFGAWPIAGWNPWKMITGFFKWLSGWDRALDQSWLRTIQEFRKIGYETDSILSVRIMTHPEDKTSRIIHIAGPGFGLQAELLIEGMANENVRQYFKSMMSIATTTTGADYIRSEIELKRSLDFERKLANISMLLPLEEEFSNIDGYNLLTLRHLEEKYPHIHWLEYINSLLPSSISVNEDEVVWLSNPSYFTALKDLLNETPPNVINTYLIWRAIWSQLQLIPFHEKNKERICIQATTKSLTVAVSAMYVRRHFDQSTKGAVSKMVKRIFDKFAFILMNSSWMDGKTWMKYLEKLGSMYTYIGYPDELMDDSEIEKVYEHLRMDEFSFFSSLLSINRFNADRIFMKIREPMQKNDWTVALPAFIVNAAYMQHQNGLEFTAAIFQGDFFSSKRPWYMNFGAIGSIIGHELTHGFDNKGRFNDTLCINSQYENFTEPMTGLKVNGFKTLRENVADNVGFKLSYLAYLNWEKENGVEPKLPGLNYTSQQMFWISAAQMYCSVSKPEFMDTKIKTDEHSPDRFRVIGSFRNQKEFAEDFQCPERCPMNPVKKCVVW